MTAPEDVHLAIALPCYNAGPWISKTLDSALAQAEAMAGPLTVVVVDDGSTDDTLDALRRYEDRITLETGPNRGACAARNRGFELAVAAGATHVLFLDADDYLEGPFLAGLAETAARTGADMVMGNMHLEYPGEGGAPPDRHERFYYADRVAPEEFFIGWAWGKYVNPSGLLWSVDLVRRIDGWDESLARAQDLDITLRAMLERPHVEKSEPGAAIHARVNSGSISQQLTERAQRSRFRAMGTLHDRITADPELADFLPALPRFEAELYRVQVACLRDGHPGLAREVGAWLKARGWRGHPGTLPHRILSTLIGLENKVRLVNFLRGRTP